MPAKPEDLLNENCVSEICVAREIDVAAMPADEAAELVESALRMLIFCKDIHFGDIGRI